MKANTVRYPGDRTQNVHPELRLHHSDLPPEPRLRRPGAERLGSLRHPGGLHRRTVYGHHLQRRPRRSWASSAPARSARVRTRSAIRMSNAPHQYAGSAQASAAGLTWFNTACFAPTPEGAVRPGNTGRYTVARPGLLQPGRVAPQELQHHRAGQRCSSASKRFNTLNWVNPTGLPAPTTPARCSAQISSFRAPRRVQLALKFIF